MNILFEIGHPAHVHKFSNVIDILNKHGHHVHVFAKNQLSIITLLDKKGISYISAGEKRDNLLGKAFSQIKYDLHCLNIALKFRIDIMVGSIAVAHVSKITGIPSILFDDDDDEVEPLMVKYAHPFFSMIVSPNSLYGHRGRKDTIYYSGYHELAYLHPNRFVPDNTVLDEIGIQEGEPYFILRFNAFKAHHDVGVEGLSIENKRKLIKILSCKGKVFITTERNIDEEFNKYQLKIAPEKIHSFIYYATMLIGDSQTMTSEAAVLGTPAIRCNTFVGRISYLEEEEHKYGLTYGFLPSQADDMFGKIEDLMAMPDLKEEWRKRRLKMLADKIDVTAFFTWFIEEYPKSAQIMKENPDYQDRFR